MGLRGLLASLTGKSVAKPKRTWVRNDGGRYRYFKGNAGDCGARAMAIALGLDYKACYDELAAANKERTGKRSARNGIHKSTYSEVLKRHGWVWHSAPVFKGRKARCSDLKGVVIARQAKHFVAVIDGVAYDTFDCSGRMVYGYWSKITGPKGQNESTTQRQKALCGMPVQER